MLLNQLVVHPAMYESPYFSVFLPAFSNFWIFASLRIEKEILVYFWISFLQEYFFPVFLKGIYFFPPEMYVQM